MLIVPKAHYATAAELAVAEPTVMADVISTAAAVAADEGLDNGYRLVLNTGADAGQSVFHVHCHLLGGRYLEWPPG